MLVFPDDVKRVAPQIARENFYFFVRWMFAQRRGFKWLQGAHHKLICEALMRVFAGATQNLIINIPPRYSKTELLENFIAWALGRVPDSEFIYTSYSGTLATNNSWHTKEIVAHPEYHRIFPDTMLRADSKARDHWRTSGGGVVYASGAEGTITGFGGGKMRDGWGGAILIDDPHKVDEIRSDVMRKGVHTFYQETLQSRRNAQHTPIILIMQRLMEDDLAGWLMAGNSNEKWECLTIPALCEDAATDPLGRQLGEALWPEKHTATELLEMQTAAPFMFAGQYQQRPAPVEGNIYRPDQIQIVDTAPACTKWCRGYDFGSTVNGDWTVGLKLGLTRDQRVVIADMLRIRCGPDERDAAIMNAAAGDGRGTWIDFPQDPGQAGKTQVLYLTKKLAGYRVSSSPETGDKVVRAQPWAAQINVGNVMMVKAPWNQALTDEYRLFPNGAFDDISDAGARAFAKVFNKMPSFFG